MLRKRDRRDGQGRLPWWSALLGFPLIVAVTLPVFVIPRTGEPAFDALVLTVYGCLVVALLILADRVLHRGVPRGPKDTARVRSRFVSMVIIATCAITFLQASEILIRTGSWGVTFLLRIATATAGMAAVHVLIDRPSRLRPPAP